MDWASTDDGWAAPESRSTARRVVYARGIAAGGDEDVARRSLLYSTAFQWTSSSFSLRLIREYRLRRRQRSAWRRNGDWPASLRGVCQHLFAATRFRLARRCLLRKGTLKSREVLRGGTTSVPWSGLLAVVEAGGWTKVNFGVLVGMAYLAAAGVSRESAVSVLVFEGGLESHSLGHRGCCFLGGKRYYTKLDVIAAFNQLRDAEGDERKTAFTTRFGQYESLVIPFGMRNAPASLQAQFSTGHSHGHARRRHQRPAAFDSATSTTRRR